MQLLSGDERAVSLLAAFTAGSLMTLVVSKLIGSAKARRAADMRARRLQKWEVQLRSIVQYKCEQIKNLLENSAKPDPAVINIVAVTGSTGNVGTWAVPYLAERLPHAIIRACVRVQQPPRSWEKYKNIEIVSMNSNDQKSVDEAMKNVDRVLLIHSATSNQMKSEIRIIDSAITHGAQMIVKVGCPPGADDPETNVLFNRNQNIIQNHLRQQGEIGKISYAIVRPNFGFANVFALCMPTVQYGFCSWPWYRNQVSGKEVVISMSDPRDQAEVAAVMLSDPYGHIVYDRREVFLHGPEQISATEMTKQVGEALGKKLKFSPMSQPAFQAMLLPMVGYHLATSISHVFQECHDIDQLLMNTDSTELERLLGRKPYTLKSYLKASKLHDKSRLELFKQDALASNED